jgi:hypothetical protein
MEQHEQPPASDVLPDEASASVRRMMKSERRRTNFAVALALMSAAASLYTAYDNAWDKQVARDEIAFNGFFTADRKVELNQISGRTSAIKEIELVPLFTTPRDVAPKEGRSAHVPVLPTRTDVKDGPKNPENPPPGSLVYQVEDPLFELCRAQGPDKCKDARLVGLEAKFKAGGVERTVLIRGVSSVQLQ